MGEAMWLTRIQEIKPDLEIWTLALFVSCVAKSMNSLWMCKFAALHIYMTVVCLHVLKLSTKRRPRFIWNVIYNKWQCMLLLSLLQLLDLNSIDYSFARMMIWLGICKFFRVFFFPCYHGFNVLSIFSCNSAFNFFSVLWNQNIGERSINKLFSYIKCCHDNDIVKGQCCSDKDSEER